MDDERIVGDVTNDLFAPFVNVEMEEQVNRTRSLLPFVNALGCPNQCK